MDSFWRCAAASDEGRALLTEERARLVDLGAVVAAAMSACNQGDFELLAGNYVAAESLLGEGCGSLEAISETGFLSTYVAEWGQALLGLGRLEEASAAAARSKELGAADDIATQMLWRQLQAKLLARRGEHDEAVRLAEEAVALGEPTDALLNQTEALLDLADVYEYASRTADARAALERALDLGESKGNRIMAARACDRIAALAGD